MGGSPAVAFHSAENKAVLWAALRDAGAFEDMQPGTERQVMSSIESRMVQAAAGGDPSSSDLTQLNKTVLRGVLSDLSAARQRGGGGRGDPSVARAFASKQAEIDEMAQGARPQRINFSEDLDSPMGGEMDRAMQEAVSLRTAQTNASQAQHQGTRKQAENWLGVKATKTGVAPPNMQLKIGESVASSEVGAVAVPVAGGSSPPKQVRFGDSPVRSPAVGGGAQTFLSALKPGKPAADGTDEKLASIDSSLKTIAEALTRLAACADTDAVATARRLAASRATRVSTPSPISSAGSGPAEIALPSDKDGQDD